MARCRICSGVIQTRRDLWTRAGYCSSFCGKQGRDRHGEFVARMGTEEGELVRYDCACGTSLVAPTTDTGTRIHCTSCDLWVWVPDAAPALDDKKPTIVNCGNCGRKVKSNKKWCTYCGEATR